jgi:hypothetical protein
MRELACAPLRGYRRRDPEKTLLHRVVRERLETFLAAARERSAHGRGLPAAHLMHLHHRFAEGVAFFQVAIALGAVAALTRKHLVWLGSLAVGAIGLVFFAMALAS